MPKKFAGENSKAVAAKAKKSEKAEAEKLKKDKEIDNTKLNLVQAELFSQIRIFQATYSLQNTFFSSVSMHICSPDSFFKIPQNEILGNVMNTKYLCLCKPC